MEFTQQQVNWLKNTLGKEEIAVRVTSYDEVRKTYKIQFLNGFRVAAMNGSYTSFEVTKGRAAKHIEDFMRY